MVRRSDTRQRMLDTAAGLFHAQGYHATGLNQLVTAGRAPKGSLYFHFPGGKEQLAAEAIHLSAARLRDVLSELVADAPDAATAIGCIVDALAASLSTSDFQLGCPLATVALEAADNPAIREACSEGYASWCTLIADFLTRQGLPDERAAELATVVLAGLEGGLLLARTLHDVAPLHAVGAHLRATLEKEFS